MNLVELREKFVKHSGRYDLVVDTTAWVDNGADFYINNGQKLLERLAPVPMNFGSFYRELAIGEYAVAWEYSTRAVQEVWIETATARVKAKKIPLSELKEGYYDLVSDQDGQPANWCYAVADLRGVNVVDKDSLGEYIESVEPAGVTVAEARGIIIAPVPTVKVNVQVKGMFKQFVLTDDDDENFWSIEEPDLLLRAALYTLDTFFHGNSAMKNWYQSLLTDAQQVEFDHIDEYSTDITQMRG